jgi:hypothetical protein
MAGSSTLQLGQLEIGRARLHRPQIDLGTQEQLQLTNQDLQKNMTPNSKLQ